MARERWEKGTFAGTHHRPRDTQRGRSLRECQDKASFDNEPATGCGALFLLLVVLGAILAAVAS